VPQPVEFGGIGSKNPLSFGCYNAAEILQGKTMKEHLPFAGAKWHFDNPLSDMFGPERRLRRGMTEATRWRTPSASIGRSSIACTFWVFASGAGTIGRRSTRQQPEGVHENIDRILPTMESLQKLSGIQCGWTTQNLFSLELYREGASTANQAGVYAHAWAQTKKMLEVGKRLGARNHVFWGGREGYNHLLATMLGLEQKHLASFLRMAVDYAKKIGFGAQFLIERSPASRARFSTTIRRWW